MYTDPVSGHTVVVPDCARLAAERTCAERIGINVDAMLSGDCFRQLPRPQRRTRAACGGAGQRSQLNPCARRTPADPSVAVISLAWKQRMDSILQSTLRAHLHERRHGLDEVLASLAARSGPVELDQTVQGRLSRIDAISQQQMAQASAALLRQDRARIDAAIGRMDAGRYGDCCRCSEAMDIERLKADPSAPFCLDCLDEMAEERRQQARRP